MRPFTPTERPARTRSLAVTIAVMFLALNAAVLFVSSSLHIYFSLQSQQELIYNRLQLIAQTASSTVNDFFEEKLSSLRKSVTLSNFASQDLEGRRLVLDRLLGNEPSIRQIVLLDGRKRELVRVSRMSRLMKGQLTEDHVSALFDKVKEGSSVVSPVYTDDITSEPMLLLAAPFTDTLGDFKGMLIAEIHLKFIWDLWGLIDSTLVGNDGLAYVSDKEGNIIAYKDINRVLEAKNVRYFAEINKFIRHEQKRNGIPITRGIRGNYVTVAYAPLSTLDWAVVVELPVVNAYRPIITYSVLSVGVVLMSLALTILLGFSLSKRITRPLIHLRDVTEQISKGDRTAEIRIESKDEIGELAGSFNQMVTDLRNTTVSIEELQKEQKRFMDIAFSMADFIWEVDVHGVYTYCSEKVSDILGYTARELVGRKPFDLMPPDEAGKTGGRFEAFIANRQIIRDLENWNVRKDGKRVCLLTNGVPIIDDQGNLKGYRGVDKDITERKAMEKQLQEEKERLSVTLRSIGDGVIATDVLGKVALINKAAEEFTGWSQEDALGRPVQEVLRLIHEEGGAESGDVVGATRRAVLVSKDGKERQIADSRAPIRDKESKTIGNVIVFRDVTEENRREQERIRAQKLESIGLLAGGIAHDFNNILVGVHSNISILKVVSRGEKDIQEILHDMEQASLQARTLTGQLLTFAKGGLPVKKVINIAELITSAVHFSLRGTNAKAEFDVPDSLWPVEADQGQIIQVINNLVLNADQAMPHGGTIRVHAENVTLPAEGAQSPETGRYVMLSIRDTGVGIPKENLGRIFDPYFTTKQKGNGLGLATSYSIIKNHNGHIVVESEPGKGTTFRVYLPAREGLSLGEEKKEMVLVTGKGRILVLDDEELVRNVFKRILNMLGYSVECSVEGKETIEKFKKAKESGAPFDVVIMDLTIPGGMGGKDVITFLREISPDVRAIASSGYSTDPIMSSFREYGFTNVLNKPFTIEEVSAVLVSTLNGK